MTAYRLDNIAPPVAYQLCRTRAGDGAIGLVLSLIVGQETVSVTTIERLSVKNAAKIVSSCVARLDELGIRPVEDAVACDRAA